MHQPETVHLANGYRLRFPETAGAPHIICLATDAGSLVGKASWLLRPSLFSPITTPDKQGREQWLRLDDETILLVSETRDDETSFALVRDTTDDTALREAAETLLAMDPDQAWAEEVRLRAAFWTRSTGEAQVLTAQALEELVFHLEPATPQYPYRWSTASFARELYPSVNQVLPLVLAWLQIDPDVASDILTGILSHVQPDGQIAPHPAAPPASRKPWPLLAHATMRVAESNPTAELGTTAANLAPYLLRTLSRADPDRTGRPCWPTESEAWIPTGSAQDTATPALAGWLLAEIDAVLKLSQPALPERRESIEALREDYRRLTEGLEDSLWDRDAGLYRPRTVTDGEPREALTLAGLIPLAWPSLPPDRRTALVRHLDPDGLFGDPSGAPVRPAADPANPPPPIPVFHQIALIDALDHPATRAQHRAFKERLLTSLLRFRDRLPRWPLDLRDGEPSPASVTASPDRDTEAPIVTACLAVLACPVPLGTEDETSRSALVWNALDRHRAVLVFGLIALLVAGVSLSAFRQLGKPDVEEEGPVSTADSSLSLAKHLATQGKTDLAMSLLEEGSGDSAGAAANEFLRATIHFRRGEFSEAESGFRTLLEDEAYGARATVNLALTLVLRNRIDQALPLYESCAENFTESHPAIAHQAATAAGYLRQHGHTLLSEKDE